MSELREIPCSRELWLEIADCSTAATFFHTPLWADIITAADPRSRVRARAFDLPSGAIAVLPLIQTSHRCKGLLYHCASMPYWVYGGPIASEPLDEPERWAIWRHVFADRRLASVEVIGNPLVPGGAPPGCPATVDSTHRLDLAGGFAAVLASFRPAARRHLRRAEERAVRVRCSREPADLDLYLELRAASRVRWQATTEDPYSPALLRACLTQDPDRARLWLAERDGQALAGALILEWGRHAVYWHGASRDDPDGHRPSHALHGAIAEDLCRRGFEFYDLNPSGGNPGVVQFKVSLGAVEVGFERWSWTRPWLERIDRLRSGAAS